MKFLFFLFLINIYSSILAQNEYDYSTLNYSITQHNAHSAVITFTPKSNQFKFNIRFKLIKYVNNRYFKIKLNELKIALLKHPKDDPYRTHYPEFTIEQNYGYSGEKPNNFNTGNFKRYALKILKMLLVKDKLYKNYVYKKDYDEKQMANYVEDFEYQKIKAELEYKRLFPSDAELLRREISYLKHSVENLETAQYWTASEVSQLNNTIEWELEKYD